MWFVSYVYHRYWYISTWDGITTQSDAYDTIYCVTDIIWYATQYHMNLRYGYPMICYGYDRILYDMIEYAMIEYARIWPMIIMLGYDMIEYVRIW